MLESHLLHLLPPTPTPLPTRTLSWAINSIGRIYLFILSLLGVFSSCGKQGHPLVTVLRLLFAGASLAEAHGPQGGWAAVVAACERSSFGPRALEHRLSSAQA